jgi:hypothetical protein
MKRSLIALAVGTTAFGSIYGLAASLGVNSDTLGSGTAAVAACQTNPVRVTYTPTYVAGTGYKATTVSITGLESTCVGKSAFVTLTGTGALATPVQATGTVPSITSPATTTTLDITTAVIASEVTGVNVAITG